MRHQTTIRFLGGCLSAGIFAVVSCSGPKLSSQEKKRAAYALKQMTELDKRAADVAARLDKLVGEDRAFLDRHREVVAARARLAKLHLKIAPLKKLAGKLRALVKKNRSADEKQLAALARKINYRAGGLKLQLLLAIKPVEELTTAKKNAEGLVRQVTRDQLQARTFPGEKVGQAVAAAGKAYPESKSKIDARLAALTSKSIDVSVAGFEKARKKNPPDYLSMGRWAAHIRKQLRSLGNARRRLLHQLGELGEHDDLILVDMKEEHGQYFHRYKRVRGNKVVTQPWKKISHAYYLLHQANLGMCIWSKPVGVLADDAETLATPPGYVYLDNPRYGKWIAGKDGKKEWRFHPNYAYLLPLFWGGGLGAVTYAAYLGFQKLRKERKVFYGLGAAIYGSRSPRMRSRYKSYYARKARKARAKAARVRTRRTRSSRSGGYSRSTRRSGK